MLEKNEIRSLINLLDDPDQVVYNHVKLKLSEIGLPAIKVLEEAWANSLDELFQARIENITKDIQFKSTMNDLENWVKNNSDDLLEGTLILAKYQYPDLNVGEIGLKIERIQKDIWLEINNQLTALEKTKIINHILFEVHGYSRSLSANNSAQTFFLNNLLQTKKGNPISLAILYAIIAQNLDLPVYGVALPKNFILCYKDSTIITISEGVETNILFYINPFNKGVVFGKKEVELFIKQQKLENKKAYFNPCTNIETIIELVNSIILFYKGKKDETKVKDYESLLKILYF